MFFQMKGYVYFQGEKKNKKDKRHIDNFYEFSPEQSSQFDPNFVGASLDEKNSILFKIRDKSLFNGERKIVGKYSVTLVTFENLYLLSSYFPQSTHVL